MKKFIFIFINFFLILSNTLSSQPRENKKFQMPQKPAEYEAKDFSHLIGMQGFSDNLLKMHFTLYHGYVKNTNLLIKLIGDYATKTRDRDYQYQALKRRFGWEFDGMRLHEYYFGNLGGNRPLDRSTSLYQIIKRDFGSYENWKEDFIATGMMRGIGWAILYFDPKSDRLFNTWINEHALGHLAEGKLILVMDVWEHAYMPQYGIDRAKYIEAFFKNIDWDVVQTRFHNALIQK